MRSLLTFLACLMLLATAGGSVAQAAGSACSEMRDEVAVYISDDCNEVPADADRAYPHCHSACHGHHVTAPLPAHFVGPTVLNSRDYTLAAEMTLTANQADQTLRPPQA